MLCLFNQAQATPSNWKKEGCVCVLTNNVWVFKRNVYVLTNNVWVSKIMSVFVCSKELCVNIFFDCCKVLAAPLKRTFPPFFSNRMYLLKRQSRKKIQFLTSLASQNRLCWKCKMNWFKFDSVFKRLKVLCCFLYMSFLMFSLHFRGTRILCRSQNPEISPMSCEQKKLERFWLYSI